MNRLNLFLLLIIFGFVGCNPSTTSSAIPFLWNEEPAPSSDEIMVISNVANDDLRHALTIHLESLGLIIEDASEEGMTTEASEIEGNLIRLNLIIDNNVVIISGERGIPGEEEINWETIERGEEEGYASPEWELMSVLASSIDSKSILYN